MKREAEQTWAAERVENALLRERINDIAAEIARLTVALEGQDSPIEAMLAGEPAMRAADERQDRSPGQGGQRQPRRPHPRVAEKGLARSAPQLASMASGAALPSANAISAAAHGHSCEQPLRWALPCDARRGCAALRLPALLHRSRHFARCRRDPRSPSAAPPSAGISPTPKSPTASSRSTFGAEFHVGGGVDRIRK